MSNNTGSPLSDLDAVELAERFAKLTDGQKECLHLVRQLKTSKEIARMLGISKYTVDQRVERACHLLEVDGRTNAALVLEALEGDNISERFVYEPVDIANGQKTLEKQSPTPESVSDTEKELEELKASKSTVPTSSFWNGYIPKGDPDAIVPKTRIKWIAQLTIQIVVSVLILVAIGQALSVFAERTWPVRNQSTE